MKTILVPTDFSESANNALDFAIAVAKKMEAKIIVLHVFYVPHVNNTISTDFIIAEKNEIKMDSEAQLKAIEQRIIHSSKIEYKLISIEGFAVDEILNAVNKNEVDLVIMGTKGASNFVDAILGSNTAKVIERAKCPVIAVPEDTSIEGLKKITYATDYTNSDVNAIKNLVDIFRSYNAEINILHIWDGSVSHSIEKNTMDEFRKKVLDKVYYENLSFEILKGNDAEISLEEYVDEGKTDLLVMSTHHKSFFNRLFGANVTKHMAYHTSVPLMVFHYDKSALEQVF